MMESKDTSSKWRLCAVDVLKPYRFWLVTFSQSTPRLSYHVQNFCLNKWAERFSTLNIYFVNWIWNYVLIGYEKIVFKRHIFSLFDRCTIFVNVCKQLLKANSNGFGILMPYAVHSIYFWNFLENIFLLNSLILIFKYRYNN